MTQRAETDLSAYLADVFDELDVARALIAEAGARARAAIADDDRPEALRQFAIVAAAVQAEIVCVDIAKAALTRWPTEAQGAAA